MLSLDYLLLYPEQSYKPSTYKKESINCDLQKKKQAERGEMTC